MKELIENFKTKCKIDKRTKVYKDTVKQGFTEEQINTACKTHLDRYYKRIRKDIHNTNIITHKKRVEFLNQVRKLKFNPNAYSSKYNIEGDWLIYHRPSSNGKGWVCIAPDEPGNNWYMEDEIILKILTKKYLIN